jgi:hypothetical protein
VNVGRKGRAWAEIRVGSRAAASLAELANV